MIGRMQMWFLIFFYKIPQWKFAECALIRNRSSQLVFPFILQYISIQVEKMYTSSSTNLLISAANDSNLQKRTINYWIAFTKADRESTFICHWVQPPKWFTHLSWKFDANHSMWNQMCDVTTTNCYRLQSFDQTIN